MNPVVFEELTGLPAPAELFARLHSRRGSWLLESSLGGGKNSAAYSFIGFEPFLVLRSKDGTIETVAGTERRRFTGDVLKELRKLLLKYRAPPSAACPFVGGAVGFFSYEWGAQMEGVVRRAPDDPNVPDVELGFYDGLLAYEHATGLWRAVANPIHDRGADEIIRHLRAVVYAPASNEVAGIAPLNSDQEPRPLDSRERYLASVARVKDYIASGDIYQVNIAQRFQAPLTGGAYSLYLKLRDRSPAPYASFLSTSFGQIVSSSPECFLRVRGREVETRPIKGTRPRGLTREEDARLAAELLASAKERAELLMIVDLERNDLGRVCAPGSIRVEELYAVESHPTVFHLVATVKGTLAPGKDFADLLKATFPGGSITGAPKIRAMQIIDEIESSRRHVYTGSIGYIGFDGNCELNIAIRTIVCAAGTASYHVGAGIVWDSDPESEYEETLAKGKAMFEALSARPKGEPSP